jgi:hypothetical protein
VQGFASLIEQLGVLGWAVLEELTFIPCPAPTSAS